MDHKGTKVIQTTRLILRPFQIEDAEAMFKNWASDEEVTRYLRRPHHQDVTTSERILHEWIDSYQQNDFYHWGIVFREYSEEPIGVIHVGNTIDDDIRMAEVGYCIGKKWWNKGMATEALNAVIQYLFDEVGVNRVQACHDVCNPSSGEVMKKCGMRYEGTLRQADRNNQGLYDVSYYAVLASDRQLW